MVRLGFVLGLALPAVLLGVNVILGTGGILATMGLFVWLGIGVMLLPTSDEDV